MVLAGGLGGTGWARTRETDGSSVTRAPKAGFRICISALRNHDGGSRCGYRPQRIGRDRARCLEFEETALLAETAWRQCRTEARTWGRVPSEIDVGAPDVLDQQISAPHVGGEDQLRDAGGENNHRLPQRHVEDSLRHRRSSLAAAAGRS